MSVRLAVGLALFWVFQACGCAQWKPPSIEQVLPAPKLPHDVLIVEADFIRYPESNDLDQIIWREVDESLPVDSRERLAANGIRCGIVGANVPAVLDDLSQPKELSDADPTPSLTTTQRHRLTIRPNERTELLLSTQVMSEAIILERIDGGVRATTFNDAQAYFVLQAMPVGNGGATVQLIPLIKHGDVRQKFVGLESGFAYGTEANSHAYDQLAISVSLSQGQSLLVSSTPEAIGLGKTMFLSKSSAPNKPTSQRLLLTIRLAQSQQDDLFDRSEELQPLATPLE